MDFTYKFHGVICPYLMQGVFVVFLVVVWAIAVHSKAPWFAILMTAAISCFILWFVYTGYPAGFRVSSDGLTVVLTMGGEARFDWKELKDFHVTGPVGIIVVNRSHWSSRLFNKYFVFLWLLNDSGKFRQALAERVPRS